MIDIEVVDESCNIRNITFENYTQLKLELMVLVFQIISIYGYNNKNREEDRTLTFIMDVQEFLTNFENSLKKHTGELYEGYIDLKKQYKNLMRENE